MKNFLFLLPAILLVACSDKKSPEIFQGELELGTPVKTTIQDQITEWYRLQEEERRRLDEQRRPPDQPPDEPPEEGDLALNPPGRETPPDLAERPEDEEVAPEGEAPPVEGDAPAEAGVEAEPLGREEREPEDGGVVGDVGERDVEEGPRFGGDESPPAETPEERPRVSAQASPPRARSAPPTRGVQCNAGFDKRKWKMRL